MDVSQHIVGVSQRHIGTVIERNLYYMCVIYARKLQMPTEQLKKKKRLATTTQSRYNLYKIVVRSCYQFLQIMVSCYYHLIPKICRLWHF